MKDVVSRKKRVALSLAMVLAAIGIGSALLFNYIIDRDAPQLVSLKYRDKLAKGEFQEISILVNEVNPSSSIILYLNNTPIEVQLTKSYMNGTILYEATFNPSIITNREGKLEGNVTISDKVGNKLTIELSFYANLRKPEIRDLKVEKVSLGEYRISIEIIDDSPIEAYIELSNGTKIPLTRCGNRYCAKISTFQDLEFSLNAKDSYNLTSSLKGNITVPIRDKFEAWLSPEFNKELCLNLFDTSKLVREIFEKGNFDGLIKILRVANLNGTAIPKNLAYQLLDQIERDYRISHKDKLSTALKTFDIMIKVGVYNLKNRGSVYIPGNYSAALLKKLPEDLDAFSHLLKTDEASQEVSDELFNFFPIWIKGKEYNVKLWFDETEIPILIYTLGIDLKQSPYLIDYLKSPHSNPEFIQGLHRQRNFILYDILGFNPGNQTVRLIYVKPDMDYYFLFLPAKKIMVNGKEVTFPLLPLHNGTKMKEWFPSMEDRMIIYACQYHRKFTEFNAKTGEDRWPGSTDMPWSVEYGRKTLLDNLNLVWNGGKWGRFEGKLIDRIIKAYTDKEWKSYEPKEIPWIWAREMSDYEIARTHWKNWEISPIGHFEFIVKSLEDFNTNYDTILSKNIVTDLGLRFADGLALLDGGVIVEPHQYSRYRYILYTKALGYAGNEVFAEFPNGRWVSETVAGATPKYLAEQLPSSAKYAPGKMISRYAYGYDSYGKLLKLYTILPTGGETSY
ncbi:MAG: hypothetical protein QXW39_08695 [Candidatus Bathyarchaeia archaeon]